MRVTLTYCAARGYAPQAVSMAAEILGELHDAVRTLTLVPSDGGRFEIEVHGELLHSKLQTGSFPDEDAIVQSLAGG